MGSAAGDRGQRAGAARWPLLVTGLLVVVGGLLLRTALESEAQSASVAPQLSGGERVVAGERPGDVLALEDAPASANAERRVEAASVEGRLLLTVVVADQEPWAAGELVLQQLSPEGMGWETHAVATTDDAGTCELAVPSKVRLRVRLDADREGRSAGLTQEIEPLARAEQRELRLVVPRGESFFGRVVDDESRAPLAGARISRLSAHSLEFTSASRRSHAFATTGADGLFRIAHTSNDGRFAGSFQWPSSGGISTSAGSTALCVELQALEYALQASDRADDESPVYLSFVATCQQLSGDSRAAVKTMKKVLKLVKDADDATRQRYETMLESMKG